MRSLFLMLALPGLALAQEAEGQTRDREVHYPAVQTLDFDALDVRASVERPRVQLTIIRIESSFPSLFKLRTDFDAEMKRSVTDVR